MKDKEKQNDFEKGWEECQAKKKQEIEKIHNFILETFDYNSWDKARAFYRASYRIIDKDSVVLTREEYERLKRVETEKDRLYEIKLDLENQLIEKGWTDYEGADEIEKRVSKETAEKFIVEMKASETLSSLLDAGWEVFYKMICNDMYEIAKQFGVEVKE